MSNLTLNTKEIVKWFSDRGDYTHNITYNLNENSIDNLHHIDMAELDSTPNRSIRLNN
jgi:hypothetical protein